MQRPFNIDEPKYKITKLIEIESLTAFRYYEYVSNAPVTAEKPAADDVWEMMYVDYGECITTSDDRRFEMKQGDLYFHKPGSIHNIQLKKGTGVNVLFISFSCLSPSMKYFENLHINASSDVKQHIYTMIQEASMTFTSPFVKHLTEEQLKNLPENLWGSEQSIINRLEIMLIEIVRTNCLRANMPKPHHTKDVVNDDFCKRVIEYMEEHIYDGINMAELCRSLAFSKSYISKRFAAGCGCSVIKYFNIMRIQEAKRLIRETDMTFQEISEKMMLANPHYFSTLFKKHVRMTPTEYKKSCAKNWHYDHDSHLKHE